MNLPKLAIASLGGTVSMQARAVGEGVVPTVSGATLLASIPELRTQAHVTVETLGMLPSASLDFAFLLSVLCWANYQVEQGAVGVVITQGTDTLEESATFFDLLWEHDEPLVSPARCVRQPRRGPMGRATCWMLAGSAWRRTAAGEVFKW